MMKLQRFASLAIVGRMKSTPTDLLDVHAGLLPIELTLLCICHRAAVRLCTRCTLWSELHIDHKMRNTRT